jgi:hypothetical protein
MMGRFSTNFFRTIRRFESLQIIGFVWWRPSMGGQVDRHDCHIIIQVVARFSSGPTRQFFKQPIGKLSCRGRRVLVLQKLPKAIRAKLFSRRIRSFRNPVGIEQDAVPWRQGKFRRSVRCKRELPKKQTVFLNATYSFGPP